MRLELARGHDDRQARVGRIDGAAEVQRAADDVDADERAAPDHLEVRRERVRDGIESDIGVDRSAFDVDLVHGRPSAGVTQGFGGDDCVSHWHTIGARWVSPVPPPLASRAVPTALAEAAGALERVWRAHVRPLVPDADALVDVHAHLGADASDGSRLDLATLLASMDAGGVTTTWAFPFQSPPGSGLCRRQRRGGGRRRGERGARGGVRAQRAGRALPGGARVRPRRRRARHQAAHEPAGLRLLRTRNCLSPSHWQPSGEFRSSSTPAARCRRSHATSRACWSAIPARRSSSRTARSPICTRSARCATRTSASTRRSGTRSTCARCSPRPPPSSWSTAPTRPYYTPIGTQAKLFPQLAAAGASDARRRDVAALGAARLLAGEPCPAAERSPRGRPAAAVAPASPRARVPRDGHAARSGSRCPIASA